MPALDEKVLYEPVTNYFLNRGYFVVSGSPKPDIAGTSEFGLNVEGRPLRVDIVAARWDDSHQIETVAVECKMLGSTARSVGAGLSQATDYQVAFDRVFIATETIGTLGSKKSVLDALGIGHLQVFAPILEYRQTLRREEYIGEMQEALGQVKELLAVLVGPGATL